MVRLSAALDSSVNRTISMRKPARYLTARTERLAFGCCGTGFGSGRRAR